MKLLISLVKVYDYTGMKKRVESTGKLKRTGKMKKEKRIKNFFTNIQNEKGKKGVGLLNVTFL